MFPLLTERSSRQPDNTRAAMAHVFITIAVGKVQSSKAVGKWYKNKSRTQMWFPMTAVSRLPPAVSKNHGILWPSGKPGAAAYGAAGVLCCTYILSLHPWHEASPISLRIVRLKSSLDCNFVTSWIEQRLVIFASPATDWLHKKGSTALVLSIERERDRLSRLARTWARDRRWLTRYSWDFASLGSDGGKNEKTEPVKVYSQCGNRL